MINLVATAMANLLASLTEPRSIPSECAHEIITRHLTPLINDLPHHVAYAYDQDTASDHYRQS